MSGTKRKWTKADKIQMCQEATEAGATVKNVAARHGVNANLLHGWLKDPRYAPKQTTSPSFLPIEVSNVATDIVPEKSDTQSSSHLLELTLSNGNRLTVNGHFNMQAIAELARELGL